MIISSPILVEKDDKIYYKSKIDKDELFFCVSRKFKKLISPKANAALLSMLLPAMFEGEDIHVAGEIDEHLIHNINFMLQDIICIIIPKLKKIKVTADKVVKDKIIEKNVVLTGFSAGIDAFTTLEDYFLNPRSSLKITHCIFNNVGSLEGYADNEYQNRFKRMSNLIDNELGLPYIFLNSNLNKFYKHRKIGFEQTHTVRNAIIPHLLSGSGITFLYSSTFYYDKVSIQKYNDISIADTIILPLLSTDNCKLVSAGSEYTRLEKTLKISTNKTAFDYLDICISHAAEGYINCGHCRKCKRALRTFEINNTISNFKNIFNMEEYYKLRDKYNKQLQKRAQLNDNELYVYLKENNLL